MIALPMKGTWRGGVPTGPSIQLRRFSPSAECRRPLFNTERTLPPTETARIGMHNKGILVEVCYQAEVPVAYPFTSKWCLNSIPSPYIWLRVVGRPVALTAGFDAARAFRHEHTHAHPRLQSEA